MRLKNNKIAEEIIAALFAGIWAYASVSKVISHNKLIAVLYTTDLFGGYTIYLSYLVPALELILSVLIISPVTRSAGLIASLAYLLLLSAYLLYMILFTPVLPCTCVGLISSFTWLQHFWLNCILMPGASVTIFIHRRARYRIAIPSQKFRPEQL
mgnify:CR=1 FL=1